MANAQGDVLAFELGKEFGLTVKMPVDFDKQHPLRDPDSRRTALHSRET